MAAPEGGGPGGGGACTLELPSVWTRFQVYVMSFFVYLRAAVRSVL